MPFVARGDYVGVFGSCCVVEELTLTAAAWQCFGRSRQWRDQVDTASDCPGRLVEHARTDSVLLLVADQQLHGQVLMISGLDVFLFVRRKF